MLLKLLGTEINISSANTVYDSRLIRVINTDSSNTCVLVINDTDANTSSNVTLGAFETVMIEKTSNTTVQGATALAVPIAYKN